MLNNEDPASDGESNDNGTYDDTNIFARILRGELPCDKVYEDEHVLAFRDIDPKAPVHVLIVPKGRYVDVTDFAAQASAEEITAWVRAAGRVAQELGVVENGYRVLCNVGRDGHQEVLHLHMHLFGGHDLGWMIGRG